PLLLLAVMACGKIASTNDAPPPADKYRGEITATNNPTCAIRVAFWHDELADDAPTDCAFWGGTEYGDCCYDPEPVHSGLPLPVPRLASAGAVSLALSTGMARLEPNDDKAYPSQPEVSCNQAGSLEVSATGNEVHAFAGLLPIVLPHT